MESKTYEKIVTLLEYKPQNDDLFFYLLQQAFIRRSYSKENGGQNNEILEFIGDKALDLAIIKKLTEYYGGINSDGEFETQRGCNEGKLTKLKEKLVESSMLAHRIDVMGLSEYLIMGKGDIEKNIQDKQSVKEDLFEAIVGAVALDCDWDMDIIQNVVEKMLDVEYYLENGFDEDDNYVDLIQRWCQKKHKKIPEYNVYLEDDNCNEFTCELYLPKFNELFIDYGYSKSEARQNTAAKAYEYLKKNDMLTTLIDEIGEPNINLAVNQLQELAQKGYIEMPKYFFTEEKDANGNSVWRSECQIEGQEYCFYAISSTKKEAKKRSTFDMLKYILNLVG